MGEAQDYVLGQAGEAARRLRIQDEQFAAASEKLLDDLALQPGDRVVELGTGPGTFSRRVLRRLGRGGVLVGVDRTAGLLEQARQYLAGAGEARFEPVLADASQPGPWLAGARAVVGRTVLHHIPLAETFLGRLRGTLQPGTKVGFIEPEFRALLGRFAALEAAGRPELAVLRLWAEGITRFYQASGLSPAIGASLAWTLEAAGYRDVRAARDECPTDATVIENLLMYYDEIRGRYEALGLMSGAEIDRQKELLQALPAGPLPAVWGLYRVTARA